MIHTLGLQCDRRRCDHCRPAVKGGGYVWRCTRKSKPVPLVRADDGGLLRTRACMATNLSPATSDGRASGAGERTSTEKAGKGTRS